jgi:hypothetical protein
MNGVGKIGESRSVIGEITGAKYRGEINTAAAQTILQGISGH